ncbi:hypothetical protein BRADI_3g10605v3 [Brachypodium distachyon]|uniref:Uncharacterized protein n=1 Tax=Brachypodium distachyon TaxID=15368 RepID=A0A2K2CWF4_BRADI|nr:hypothetical protein BRADI_3g10605v3 [Brachypodium distachyon]
MHGTCSMKWQTEGNACCWQRLSLPQPPCSPACPLCAEGVAVPLFALPRSSSTVLWSCAEGVAAACVRRCLINAQPAQLGSFCGCHGIGRRAPAANRQQNFILLIPCGALLVQRFLLSIGFWIVVLPFHRRGCLVRSIEIEIYLCSQRLLFRGISHFNDL